MPQITHSYLYALFIQLLLDLRRQSVVIPQYHQSFAASVCQNLCNLGDDCPYRGDTRVSRQRDLGAFGGRTLALGVV